MDWNGDSFGRLTDAVNAKYDGHFWNCLPAWREYLKSSGIEWVPQPNLNAYTRRKKGEKFVWTECPWSLHNSPIGNIAGKVYLVIPGDVAEKIVVLGEMPPALTEQS